MIVVAISDVSFFFSEAFLERTTQFDYEALHTVSHMIALCPLRTCITHWAFEY